MASGNPYELYRGSHLGVALNEALIELIATNDITAALADRVLAAYDRSAARILETQVSSRATLRVSVCACLRRRT